MAMREFIAMTIATSISGMLILAFAYWLFRLHRKQRPLHEKPQITELWEQHLDKETRLLPEAMLERHENKSDR
jgi:hypothetical protein